MAEQRHPDMQAWIASLTTEDVMTMLSAAVRNRDWLAVDGAVRLLAVKDPEKAQAVYDTLTAATGLAAAAAGTES